MKRPADKTAFMVTNEGEEVPLIVPKSAVERMRKLFPHLWVEASPMLPTS